MCVSTQVVFRVTLKHHRESSIPCMYALASCNDFVA